MANVRIPVEIDLMVGGDLIRVDDYLLLRNKGELEELYNFSKHGRNLSKGTSFVSLNHGIVDGECVVSVELDLDEVKDKKEWVFR